MSRISQRELADDLLDMVEHLFGLLEQVEWHQQKYNGSPACPCCGAQQHWNHSSGCELAQVIGGKFENTTVPGESS